MTRLVKLKDAATELQVSVFWLRRELKAGRVIGGKPAGKWVVDMESALKAVLAGR